jgi:hypothetical protein
VETPPAAVESQAASWEKPSEWWQRWLLGVEGRCQRWEEHYAWLESLASAVETNRTRLEAQPVDKK